MPSRATVEPVSSRTRLLRAAKRLFARQGYEQTATSAIAREAGTSESQLMRYFGGKVGLLEAVFDEAWSELNERVRDAAAGATSHRESILAVLQAIATAFARDPDLATLFLFEGRRRRGDDPRVGVSGGFHVYVDLVRSLVRKAQAARELDRSLDPGAITGALMGATETMIRDRLLARAGGSRTFAEREIRRTLGAMLSGFAPRSARSLRSGRVTRARAAG